MRPEKRSNYLRNISYFLISFHLCSILERQFFLYESKKKKRDFRKKSKIEPPIECIPVELILIPSVNTFLIIMCYDNASVSIFLFLLEMLF